jgi:GT2 family glycosyltransferase
MFREFGAISVVIVNWNSSNQLYDAILSLINFGDGIVNEVIVIDNNSNDDSISNLNIFTSLPFSLKIIINKINIGFGSACNQGATICTSELILFLNPDARLCSGTLSKVLLFLREPESYDVGICGVQLINEYGVVARSCSRFPMSHMFLFQSLGLNKIKLLRRFGHHMEDWDHVQTRQVDQVIGAFFLVRHSLYKALGGFDERFFVYFEEVDFSYRAMLSGYKSVYISESQAFHAGGGTSYQVKDLRLFYSLRSRLLYGYKHFSLLNSLFLTLVTLFIEPWSRLSLSIVRVSKEDMVNVLSAYLMLYKALPSILRGIGR